MLCAGLLVVDMRWNPVGSVSYLEFNALEHLKRGLTSYLSFGSGFTFAPYAGGRESSLIDRLCTRSQLHLTSPPHPTF